MLWRAAVLAGSTYAAAAQPPDLESPQRMLWLAENIGML
jgi:hypothetical protein